MVAISSSAPKNILAAVGRIEVGAEDAGRLAVGEGGADVAEVVAQQRRGQALHELHRLPQLHLKHDRQIAIAAEARQVEARRACRSRSAGSLHVRRRGSRLGERFAHRALEELDEDVVLAAEIQVDGARGHPRGARDVGDLGVEEPALGEDVDGGPQDGVALGDEDGVGAFPG